MQYPSVFGAVLQSMAYSDLPSVLLCEAGCRHQLHCLGDLHGVLNALDPQLHGFHIRSSHMFTFHSSAGLFGPAACFLISQCCSGCNLCREKIPGIDLQCLLKMLLRICLQLPRCFGWHPLLQFRQHPDPDEDTDPFHIPQHPQPEPHSGHSW